ncbi:MAG: NUDIX domain-containing protein [Candidatus Nanopelagicales bacterium]|nr:NUDIX domain-containing protein [Candidatus Nanopelagicales bacterium]
MVQPPAPVPPPRREGRRFTIPTPADLRHPRQRVAVTEAEQPGQDGAEPSAGAALPRVSQAPAVPAGTPRPVPTAGPVEPPAGADGATGAVPQVPPVRPTPATLPRPARLVATGQPAAPGELAPVPQAQADAEPEGGTAVEGTRRIFPNPASLMASGRGARKVRPGGLRARRLPKVEETSAGGVVLDLTADPPAVALIARHDRRSRLLWSLPKGHVEEGETPEQAALREVFEETGLVGRIVAPLGVIDFWFVVEDKRIHKTVHHFVIEAIGGELSDEDLEVEAVEWIPYDQVVRRLAYGDERRLVEKVAQIVPGVR